MRKVTPIAVSLALLLAAGTAAARPGSLWLPPSPSLAPPGSALERALRSPLLAQADDEEPPDPDAPKARPAPGPAPQPGAAPAAAPAAPAATAEPTPPEPRKPAAPKARREVLYGAGLHLRGIFVPEWFLNAFLDASTGLYSMALGGEFVRRKGNMDLVATINFGFYSPPDGNYLGNDKQPAVDTDYIQFRDLNVLAFDVAFVWHHDFTEWLSLVYGAGLGIGVVLGDIYRISNYLGKCTPENLKDLGACNPIAPGSPDLNQWNADRNGWLNAHTGTGADTPQAPHLYREEGVWPVVPIVHLLVGLNFKINEQISIRVDTGFKNAFYVGATGHYFF